MRGRRSAVGAAELGDWSAELVRAESTTPLSVALNSFRGQVEVVAFAIQNGGYVFEHSTRSCWFTSPLSAPTVHRSTTASISASRGRITPMAFS